MLLYFIRHGQTDWNKDMRMQGQSDIPLNENGRESAIEAGKTLANTHIDLAFSSVQKKRQSLYWQEEIFRLLRIKELKKFVLVFVKA